MANTFTKIATVTVGSGGASSIEFTSISSSYTDLNLLVSGRTTESTSYGYFTLDFNGAGSFSYKRLLGYSTGVNSSTGSPFVSNNTPVTGAFGNASIYIPNYSRSSQKSFSIDTITEANSGASESALAALLAGLWSDSSAITYIKLTPWSSQTFLQYTTATLYGIKNS